MTLSQLAFLGESNCPDVTFVIDWALKTNYLSGKATQISHGNIPIWTTKLKKHTKNRQDTSSVSSCTIRPGRVAQVALVAPPEVGVATVTETQTKHHQNTTSLRLAASADRFRSFGNLFFMVEGGDTTAKISGCQWPFCSYYYYYYYNITR